MSEVELSERMIEWAVHYATVRGWAVFPLEPETKVALTWAGSEFGPERWGATKKTDEILARFAQHPDAGIGVEAGINGFFVIETDTKDGKDGAGELAKLEAKHEKLPVTYSTISPTGSVHYYFKHPGSDFYIKSVANNIAPGIDTKGDAGMVLVPPTMRRGDFYKVRVNAPIADAPAWLLDMVAHKVTDAEKRFVKHAPPTDEPTVEPWEIVKLERWVREALKRDFDWFAERETALKVVWGIKRAGYGHEGYRIAQIICGAFPETQRVDRIDRFWNDPGSNQGTASLDSFWKHCASIGIKDTPEERAAWRRKDGDQAMDSFNKMDTSGLPGMSAPSIVPACPVPLPSAPPSGSVMPRGGSLVGPRGEVIPIDADESLALEFASEHASDLRHCEELGKWLRWDGGRWQMDRTSGAYYSIREHLRRVGSGMHFQDARKILSAKTVAAVERMAKTDPRISTEAGVWDADPWLLNTPGGVVDLRTCVIREARPGDHMTKSTAVSPGGDCPTWLAFLDKSLAADAELIAFVQRMLGYSLTGITREHALFFLYGPGGNGKGVLLNTVSAILGDYSKTAPMETFTASDHKDHPTDLAGLRGARFVMASETERGRRWAEARIKSMTGGDPISARFMRQDFFEYPIVDKSWEHA